MIHPLILVAVFVVSAVLGYFIIRTVPSLLHTPLMSGMNALSGVTIVGAIVATGVAFLAGDGFWAQFGGCRHCRSYSVRSWRRLCSPGSR